MSLTENPRDFWNNYSIEYISWCNRMKSVVKTIFVNLNKGCGGEFVGIFNWYFGQHTHIQIGVGVLFIPNLPSHTMNICERFRHHSEDANEFSVSRLDWKHCSCVCSTEIRRRLKDIQWRCNGTQRQRCQCVAFAIEPLEIFRNSTSNGVIFSESAIGQIRINYVDRLVT